METKEHIPEGLPENAVDLGRASTETLGPAGINEFVGTLMGAGISEE